MAVDQVHALFAGLPTPSSRRFRPLASFCREQKGRVQAGLPWLAAELSQTVGFERLFVLLGEKGGTRIYAEDLFRCLEDSDTGFDPVLFEKLINMNNSSERFELPSAWGIFTSIRKVAIELELCRQTPAPEIARNYGVTLRYLRKLKVN